MPGALNANDDEAPPTKCGACNSACRFYAVRCDNCQRGVHLTCMDVTKQEADLLAVYVCDTCKEAGVTDEAAMTALNGKSGKRLLVANASISSLCRWRL